MNTVLCNYFRGKLARRQDANRSSIQQKGIRVKGVVIVTLPKVEVYLM